MVFDSHRKGKYDCIWILYILLKSALLSSMENIRRAVVTNEMGQHRFGKEVLKNAIN
jgi:hypothetical protein